MTRKRHTAAMRLAACLAIIAVSVAVGVMSAMAEQRPETTQPAVGVPKPAKGPLPRTAFGQPDLQGVWSFSTLTPLERPAELAGKQFMTAKEAATFAEAKNRALDHDTPEGAEHSCKGTGNYGEVWFERGSTVVKTRRTSLIVDPPDGKIPPLTAQGLKRRDALAAARAAHGPADSWEDLDVNDRCLVGFNSGPPMMPSPYNNNVQLFQTPDHFVILNEMVHDARIVPLDGRPHKSPNVRQWAGVSRGHWEGDTLVVETINFNEKNTFRDAGPHLRLIERFTRTDTDTLMYDVTVDDPETFTKPWTFQIPMSPVKGHIYEYACHEGNYGLAGILAGARAEERKAAKSVTQR
jgi:hypothetical protein